MKLFLIASLLICSLVIGCVDRHKSIDQTINDDKHLDSMIAASNQFLFYHAKFEENIGKASKFLIDNNRDSTFFYYGKAESYYELNKKK